MDSCATDTTEAVLNTIKGEREKQAEVFQERQNVHQMQACIIYFPLFIPEKKGWCLLSSQKFSGLDLYFAKSLQDCSNPLMRHKFATVDTVICSCERQSSFPIRNACRRGFCVLLMLLFLFPPKKIPITTVWIEAKILCRAVFAQKCPQGQTILMSALGAPALQLVTAQPCSFTDNRPATLLPIP